MKMVFKEWIKDPIATIMLVLYIVVGTAVALLDAWLIKLIAELFENYSDQQLILIICVAIGIVVIMGLNAYMLPWIKNHCFRSINNRWAKKLVEADYEMFTSLSCAHIWSTGEFMWNIPTVGIELARSLISFNTIVINIIAIISVSNSALVLPIVIIYSVSLFFFRLIYRRMARLDEDKKDTTRERNQEGENIVNAFQEVRSFHTGDRHLKRILMLNDNRYNIAIRKSGVVAFLHGLIELVEKGSIVAVIIYVGTKIADGIITAASAMTMVTYVSKLIGPLVYIMDVIDMLSEELALSKDYQKIIEYDNKNSSDGTIKLSEFKSEIVLKNIQFSYDDTRYAVNDVTIKVKRGQHIGICGVSGGGKSTLFKLLNRFYKPRSGKITIDGIDINDITRESYFNNVASVHQENVIFPTTIRENIMYGKPDAMEFEVIDAAKKAHIHDFIMSLPKGYETDVGPRGLKLSGGQKQRLALARMFIRRPSIILLDEATSALDNESEELIQKAIDDSDATVIAIAHRLSTIKNSDKIYVLGDKGNIIESGTHDELIRLNGEYAKMSRK